MYTHKSPANGTLFPTTDGMLKGIHLNSGKQRARCGDLRKLVYGKLDVICLSGVNFLASKYQSFKYICPCSWYVRDGFHVRRHRRKDIIEFV